MKMIVGTAQTVDRDPTSVAGEAECRGPREAKFGRGLEHPGVPGCVPWLGIPPREVLGVSWDLISTESQGKNLPTIFVTHHLPEWDLMIQGRRQGLQNPAGRFDSYRSRQEGLPITWEVAYG